MSVTVKQVEHIAGLARLTFAESEKEVMTGQLNKVLEYVEQLKELDTDHVEPLASAAGAVNVMREDKEGTSLTHREALRNAPSKTEEFFKVPKVISE